MTNLSRKARYALRALYALAGDDARGPVLIADLAEREKIPRKFLEAILLELKNAGVLKSKKGKGGGYSLARSPEQITMGQVIRIIDGPLAPIPCASERAFVKCEECVDEATCGTRQVMKKVRDAIAAILDSTTLADVQTQIVRARISTGSALTYSI
jgi:Rrf2 family protein